MYKEEEAAIGEEIAELVYEPQEYEEKTEDEVSDAQSMMVETGSRYEVPLTVIPPDMVPSDGSGTAVIQLQQIEVGILQVEMPQCAFL